MNLSLAIVADVTPDGCRVESLDGRLLFARLSRLAMKSRIRVAPGQLAALDEAADGPEVVWRWFRGPVLLVADGYAVVDYRPYQPGFRYPLGVTRIPEHLLAVVRVGAEVFFTAHEGGAIAAAVVDGRPADPARVAADLFPAIEQHYAEESVG